MYALKCSTCLTVRERERTTQRDCEEHFVGRIISNFPVNPKSFNGYAVLCILMHEMFDHAFSVATCPPSLPHSLFLSLARGLMINQRLGAN